MSTPAVVKDCSNVETSAVMCFECKNLTRMPLSPTHCFYSHDEVGKIEIICENTRIVLEIHQYNIRDLLSPVPLVCEQDEGVLYINSNSIIFEDDEKNTTVLLETDEKTIDSILKSVRKIVYGWNICWL